jgi:hypothetical protein
MATTTVHCNFTCVLQIDELLSSSKAPKFICDATIQMSIPTNEGIAIDGIVYPDTLSTKVHYYNGLLEEFVENAMVFCIGTLRVTDTGDPKPVLTIQSHCLIRFGIILLHYYHYIIVTVLVLLEILLIPPTRIPYHPQSIHFSPLLVWSLATLPYQTLTLDLSPWIYAFIIMRRQSIQLTNFFACSQNQLDGKNLKHFLEYLDIFKFRVRLSGFMTSITVDLYASLSQNFLTFHNTNQTHQ